MHSSIKDIEFIKFAIYKFETVISLELLNTLLCLLLNHTLPLFKGLENIRFIQQKIDLKFVRKVINEGEKIFGKI